MYDSHTQNVCPLRRTSDKGNTTHNHTTPLNGVRVRSCGSPQKTKIDKEARDRNMESTYRTLIWRIHAEWCTLISQIFQVHSRSKIGRNKHKEQKAKTVDLVSQLVLVDQTALHTRIHEFNHYISRKEKRRGGGRGGEERKSLLKTKLTFYLRSSES